MHSSQRLAEFLVIAWRLGADEDRIPTSKQATTFPFEIGEKFSWQARRYASSLSRSVVAEMVGYKPVDENAVVLPSRCLRIQNIRSGNSAWVAIRYVLPWNYGNPSAVKAPKGN